MSDGPSVVWWDPAVIDLDVDDTTAIRHQRILEASPTGSGTSDSE
jgi:ATP-dependent helicase/nuclease subunit A